MGAFWLVEGVCMRVRVVWMRRLVVRIVVVEVRAWLLWTELLCSVGLMVGRVHEGVVGRRGLLFVLHLPPAGRIGGRVPFKWRRLRLLLRL